MKKVIRIVSLLLVLVSVLGFVPAPVSAAEQVIDENSGWYWPTADKTITSPYGKQRSNSVHQGLDIRAATGVEIKAARYGYVYRARWDPENEMGYYVTIRHGTSNGKYIFSTYMHLSKIDDKIKEGMYINVGTVIGESGNTGNSNGAHLHFHVFKSDSKNPTYVSPAHKNYNDLAKNYVDITPKVNISLTEYPKEIYVGSGFGLRGVVSSNYTNYNLSRVDGVIYNASGQPVMSATEWPNASSMDIRYSAINNKLIFNNLDVGSYTLKITATDVGGHTSYWEQGFTVKNQVTTISLHSVEVPSWLAKGKFFGLRGIYDSNYRITSVKGEIIQNGKTVQQTMDYPYSKRFDVRYGNVNNQLHFNWLKRGAYTLKITVTLENGYTRVDSYTFHIY